MLRKMEKQYQDARTMLAIILEPCKKALDSEFVMPDCIRERFTRSTRNFVKVAEEILNENDESAVSLEKIKRIERIVFDYTRFITALKTIHFLLEQTE
jgi:hypothetical protein